MSGEQASLYEAEALAAMQRAVGSAHSTAWELDAAALVMVRADLAGARDLAKVIEIHRLATVRLDVFARRLAEGRLSDAPSWGTP